MSVCGVGEKSYAVDARYANFYSGGDVAWSTDGALMYFLNNAEVAAVDVRTGLVHRSYGLHENGAAVEAGEEDTIYVFDLAPSNEYLLTAHRSSLLRLWTLEDGRVHKLWKSQHKGPVVKVAFSANSKLVCSSGADSTLRIWDYGNSRCLCALKGFAGPALVLHFHPNAATAQVFAAGSDNAIYCWNYESKKLLHQLRGHLSQVTAFSFKNKRTDCKQLVSVSRDRVLIVWRLLDGGQEKVIPMYEELEGVSYLDKANIIVACAKGALKLVNLENSKISSLHECAGEYEIKGLLLNEQTQQLAAVTADHNILIFNRQPAEGELSCVKQLIGFNDEILDACLLGETERFLAIATNSKHIKLYDIEAEMDCKIITGHKDTVMSLSTPGASKMLLSAGRDFSILLWQLDEEDFTLTCLARNLSSHTATIGCISFGFGTHSVFASVCQSGSMKVWRLQTEKLGGYSFSVKYAVVAHEKEVNCVAYSPNNKLIATASQDKTAKLWSADSQALLGTLRGHGRGVWCVRFSPVDQIVLTASSDCSLRLWSLANMACLKRLEQACTVLRAEFIEHGKFIISAGSDGLLKLWNIKTNTCTQTLDEHEDRVWALAVSARKKKYFFSAGADSKLIRWQDTTEQSRQLEIDKRQALLEQEQTLQSLLHQGRNMERAFILALNLGKPKVVYNMINECVRQRKTERIREMISKLNGDQRQALADHVKVWTTNSRHSQVSNIVLHFLLSDLLLDPGLQRGLNTTNLVEVLTPYTQRHFKRASELNKELNFLEFIVKCM